MIIHMVCYLMEGKKYWLNLYCRHAQECSILHRRQMFLMNCMGGRTRRPSLTNGLPCHLPVKGTISLSEIKFDILNRKLYQPFTHIRWALQIYFSTLNFLSTLLLCTASSWIFKARSSLSLPHKVQLIHHRTHRGPVILEAGHSGEGKKGFHMRFFDCSHILDSFLCSLQ